MKLKLALVGGLLLAGANAMACYTVYDSSNRVVYQGVKAPVDMSRPLHETLGQRLPGAHMVFDQSATCTPVALAQVARPAGRDVPVGTIRAAPPRPLGPGASAPLLTDRNTAARQGLPHTVVAGDVVMVPAAAAARAHIPSLTVIPGDVALASARPAPMNAEVMAGAPDTRTMGAGPARRGAAQPPTVITEMRDGSTLVQRGGQVAVVR